MSRYNFHGGELGVVVGWDDPMETFFLYTYDLIEGDDEALFSVGNSSKEITSLFGSWEKDGLLSIASDHGILIPDDICKQLERDQDNAVAPTQHQMAMRSILDELRRET
jgi:hypothetical protein